MKDKFFKVAGKKKYKSKIWEEEVVFQEICEEFKGILYL
jgi:hypothetical protein